MHTQETYIRLDKTMKRVVWVNLGVELGWSLTLDKSPYKASETESCLCGVIQSVSSSAPLHDKFHSTKGK